MIRHNKIWISRMENPEIIINALTNEIASLKCQHRDELERVRMERRAAPLILI